MLPLFVVIDDRISANQCHPLLMATLSMLVILKLPIKLGFGIRKVFAVSRSRDSHKFR